MNDLNDALEALDYDILRETVQVKLHEDIQRSLDYVLEKDEVRYAAVVNTMSTPQNFLTSSFYRTFTYLEAIRRQEAYREMTPLVVLVTETYDQRFHRRIQKVFRTYAPDFEWIVISEGGDVLDGSGEDGGFEDATSTAVASPSVSLGFGDLDLWLFKKVLYEQHQPDWWDGDGEPIRNPYQLEKRGNVSRGKAYKWTHAMKAEGFLEETEDGLQVVNLKQLLERWDDQYSLEANRDPQGWALSDGLDRDGLIDRWRTLATLKQTSLVLTGAAAAEWWTNKRIPDDAPIAMFRLTEDAEEHPSEWGLQEVDPDDANVVSYVPKYGEAVTRAVVTRDGIPTTDPVQMVLDGDGDEKDCGEVLKQLVGIGAPQNIRI